MFPNCWHRTLHVFTLAAALFLAQSASAQTPPQCTLTANPAMISAGASSTLTANCPAATSFEWSGGTCADTPTTSSNCTVTPSVTTTYSVFGSGAGGASNAVSAAVLAAWRYDGIYRWNPDDKVSPPIYLSVHRIRGDTLIGTIYWNYTANSVQIGTRTIRPVDTFDLLQGQIVDSKATMSGPAFFRACILSYDFTFNSDSTLNVHLNKVSNGPVNEGNVVDCAARYPVVPDWTIPRIF